MVILAFSRPEKVGDNGYGYYTPSQFFDFYLISSLKRAGSPLADIRRYIESPDAKEFLEILYRQRENLMHEKAMLERMEQLVEQSVTNIEQAMSAETDFDKPEITHCQEEYFIATKAPDIQDKTELEQFGYLRDHVHYCKENDIGAEFQIGVIVLKEELLAGTYRPDYFCSRVFRMCRCDRLFVKPAGTYVSMLHKGATDTRPALKQLMTYIEEKGLTVIGNAYECELAGFLSTRRWEKLYLPLVYTGGIACLSNIPGQLINLDEMRMFSQNYENLNNNHVIIRT